MVKVVSEIADRQYLPEIFQTEKADVQSVSCTENSSAIGITNSVQSKLSEELSTISRDTEDVYPDLELSTVKNPIKADSEDYSQPSVFKSHQEHLNKIKMMRKTLSYNKTGIFQKILAFFSLAYDYEDDGTDEILANLLDEMQNKSYEQKQELIKEFYENTREAIDIPQTEKTLKTVSWFKKISSSIVKYVTKNFSDKRSFNTKLALAVMKNPKERELLMLGALDDVDGGHKSLKDVIVKYLPDGMNEDEVNEVFEAIGEFADKQAKDILSEIQNGNFKEKFIALVRKKAKYVIEKAKQRTKEFIKAFLTSEKGKTVKRKIENAFHKIETAKKEVRECKEKKAQAVLELKVKKAESEQAIAKAKEEEKKARSFAADYGGKYLDNESLYKFVKQKSPRQAYDFMDAQESRKKAYWAEYDAKSAEKYAELLENIANRHLAFEQHRADIMLQAFSNTYIG